MRKFIILFFLLFLCATSSYAQDNIVFGAGTSATSRLLDFHNRDYSTKEFKELKQLETIKPSYFGYLGYIFKYNSKIDMQINIGYRLSRYGSKIYAIPRDVQNITPQYPKTRQVLHQNQFNLDFILQLKSIQLLKSDYLFIKSSLVYNFQNYKIHRGTFNYQNKGTMSGILESSGFIPHRFDAYLGTGFNYNLYKDKLNFQPFIGMFILPYETDGINYSYLYFNKNVKGFLLDIGFNLQYKIR